MNELLTHIQRCLVQAGSIQPGDVPSMVALHGEILAAPELVSKGTGAANTSAVFDSITQIAGLVEGIIMEDPSMVGSSIADVSRQIEELQNMLSGVGLPPAEVRFLPITKPVAIKPAGHVIGEEQAITENDVAMALEFVGEASSHLDAAEAALLKLEDDPSDMDQVNAVFRAFHTIKGVAGFLGLKQIAALAHSAETLLDLARKGKLQLVGSILDLVLEARDSMGKLVQGVESAAKSNSKPPTQPGLEAVLTRLDSASRGESILATPPTSKALLDTPKSESAPLPNIRAHDPVQTNTVAATSTSTATTSESVVKVSTSRLDALIDAVGELVIGQAMVTQDLGAAALVGDQRLARNISHLGKITRGLQELSMSMRMVPIAAVFQKMARLARDVSRKAGKEIEFVQVGGDTELDRNVVDAISDPLVHMVRNSVDHGVETPENREKVGKPRTGRVLLKAFHQSGNVVVEITDDGRGLNKERIVQKAIAAGLVKEGQELTEQQIFQLIFHPGLSTAEKLTDISGRGVGMDVVRKNVEALRGRIEITSVEGKGSTFTVRLPLTLAVIDGLIVRVGTHRYIVPITSIEQSIRPTPEQMSTIQGKGELCMVRDRLIPLVRLHKLFRVEAKNTDPAKALVVIVQQGPDRCCLLVDELIGQQQVVIKSVGKEIGELPGIAGCAILGDGNVSLILDVAGIIHSALK